MKEYLGRINLSRLRSIACGCTHTLYETVADAIGFIATYAVLYGMMALVAR